MKVLIVAKTRRGGGACVGAITEKGQSVRLMAADAATNQRAGLEYEVGEVWEIEATPDPHLVPPHVENVIVHRAQRLKRSDHLERAIHRYMPPVRGGPEELFEGRLQRLPGGTLYIAERTGLPGRSTMFWVADHPLELDCEGKRIHYRYPGPEGGSRLTFVGFQEPLPEIPAGTLLRVSLAHWWRPKDRPEEELRCHLQLSGWCLPGPGPGATRVADAAEARAPNRPGSAAPKPDLERARAVLKQTFGFADFLPVQAPVIARVLRGADTLAVLPTGGGKSLCYQLPALLLDGLTVVVSPLIALMQDQVSQLRQLEVPAGFLNSTLRHQDYVGVAHRIRHGHTRILYVAPETLLRPELLLLLAQSRVACLAVDEAHCVSEWGHDFRPEYRRLQEVRSRFPQAVCLALTATATARVRADIRRVLRLPSEGEFVASFNRPNLFLSVQPRRDGLAQTVAFLNQHRGESGIIYCGTRKHTDELCAELNANGWPALPYHAGLEDEVRRRNQERFVHDEVPVMVATIAFGMGINKSNVRFVIHYHLPQATESYYQEIGRAGRDGLPAHCLLLYSRADAVLRRRLIEQGAASEQAGRQARLNALMRYAETHGCRRVPLLAYFDETFAPPCGGCDNCVRPPPSGEQVDVTACAQNFLACVRQTGEIFGPAHIIGILRGSKAERIVARRHDRLSLHGAGKEHSAEEWRELAEHFIHQGLVDQDLEFGGLRLTPKGRQVLQGEKVHVPIKLRAAAAPEPARAGHDPDLFQRLRQLRREFAAQASVPPYMVFSDRALTEMATFLPQDKAQLLAINGVGEVKLARYGEAFLRAIREHRRSHPGPG